MTTIELTERDQKEIIVSAEGHVRSAAAMVIAEKADAEHAADLTRWIKQTAKKAEEQRVRLVKPLNDHVKMINAEYAKITEPLKQAEQVLKDKLLAWQQAEQARLAAEEAARRAEDDRLIAEAQAAKQAGDAEREAALIEQMRQQPPVFSGHAPPVRGELGTVASVRKIWTYEVVDAAQVPREFMQIHDKAVRAAIAEGALAIPGLRIFAVESVAIR